MHDRPSDAPNYEEPEWLAAEVTKAVVVGRGTQDGAPTVDIQFTTKDGQKHIAMLTGALLQSISAACIGVEMRTRSQDAQN